MKVQFCRYKLSRVALSKRFRGYKLSQTQKKFVKSRKFIPIKYIFGLSVCNMHVATSFLCHVVTVSTPLIVPDKPLPTGPIWSGMVGQVASHQCVKTVLLSINSVMNVFSETKIRHGRAWSDTVRHGQAPGLLRGLYSHNEEPGWCY